jgi:hypothetical protein
VSVDAAIDLDTSSPNRASDNSKRSALTSSVVTYNTVLTGRRCTRELGAGGLVEDWLTQHHALDVHPSEVVMLITQERRPRPAWRCHRGGERR